MKYFTKEWYEACQAADWCLNMAVSKNAEEFSEEYYKDLYTRRRRAFVKQMKEEEGEAFDKIAAEVAFMKYHEETVKRMERILPIEIKAAVADMRVLALDIATKEVRHQLKAWCEEQKSLQTQRKRNMPQTAPRRAVRPRRLRADRGGNEGNDIDADAEGQCEKGCF